ncbi:MAG: hypothetical protein HY895_08145 [Deltaproteobacteria bacterium]|nr:hypothetical protein [Deltaproteobacteria bacterium]
MNSNKTYKLRWRWVLGVLVIGCISILLACGEAGQGDLSKKAPPSLGAIAEVDGSDDTKKEGKKPQTGAEQAPAQSTAGSQPVQAAPKQ